MESRIQTMRISQHIAGKGLSLLLVCLMSCKYIPARLRRIFYKRTLQLLLTHIIICVIIILKGG